MPVICSRTAIEQQNGIMLTIARYLNHPGNPDNRYGFVA
jgi:hypothetical protein